MRSLRLIFLFTCLIVASGSSARAELFYGFSVNGGAPQGPTTLFNANVGDTLSVQIHFMETAPDTLLFERGLVSFEFGGEFTQGFGVMSNYATNSDGNTGFNIESEAVNGNRFQSFGAWAPFFGDDNLVDINNNGNLFDDEDLIAGRGRGASNVMVASFDFEITAEGITHFDLYEPFVFSERNPDLNLGALPNVEDTQLGNYRSETNGPPAIDEFVFGTVAAPKLLRLTVNSITVVPEPGSAIFFLGLGGFLATRRRRTVTLAR